MKEATSKLKVAFEEAKESLPGRDQLILSNRKLVYHIANRFEATAAFYRTTVDDLAGEGMCGLIKAANTFDPDRGYKFATYAARIITNEILLYLRRLKKQSRLNPYSLNAPITVNSTGEEIYLDATDPVDQYAKVIDLEAAKRVLKHMRQSDRELLIQFHVLGVGQRELADRLGMGQSYVSRLLKKAGNRAQLIGER